MAAEEAIHHDFWWDQPVQSVAGKEKLGFLLARQGSSEFWAHYVDGVVERINPTAGAPRPVPDPAVRTKRVSVPLSFREVSTIGWKEGGKYTGQMRRVVQCLHSRGQETRFGFKFARTHGILEWPKPRSIGATAGEESERYKLRRFWVIEVSSAGIYAAPLTYGLNCLRSANDLSQYFEAGSTGELDLAWAYFNKNPLGRIWQLKTAAEMAGVYAYGTWYTGMGWAFSWSGWNAANVLRRVVDDGVPGNTVLDYYETRLAEIAFSVIEAGELPVGITAAVTLGAPGRVTFRSNDRGTLWAPKEADEEGKWKGVKPFANTVQDSGPVHVFYDGEERILTSWGMSQQSFAQDAGLDGDEPFPTSKFGGGAPWPGLWDGVNSSQTHVSSSDTPEYSEPICQQFWDYQASVDGHTCAIKHYPVWYGNGHFTSAYVKQNWGFSGPFNLQVEAYSRTHRTSKSEPVGGLIKGSVQSYNDRAYLCSSCGGNGERIQGSFSFYGFSQLVDKTKEDRAEVKRGSSVLVLLPKDREAVAGIRIQTESYSGTKTVRHFSHKVKRGGTATAPFTPIFEVWAVDGISSRLQVPGFTNNPLPDDVTPIAGESSSATFHLRASGGINRTRIGIAASPTITPFLVYVPVTQEEAISGLVFLRGGLEFADPALVPADQKGNFVEVFDGEKTTSTGFTALGTREPIAYIGQV